MHGGHPAEAESALVTVGLLPRLPADDPGRGHGALGQARDDGGVHGLGTVTVRCMLGIATARLFWPAVGKLFQRAVP